MAQNVFFKKKINMAQNIISEGHKPTTIDHSDKRLCWCCLPAIAPQPINRLGALQQEMEGAPPTYTIRTIVVV
jgi:hypothetical protein